MINRRAGWLTPYLMHRHGLSDSLYLTHRHGFILFEIPHTATSGREFSVCGRQWAGFIFWLGKQQPMGKVYCLTWGTPTTEKESLFDLGNGSQWERFTVWQGEHWPAGRVYCLTSITEMNGSLTQDTVTRWSRKYSKRTHRAHNHITFRVYLRSKSTFWTEAHVQI